VKKWEILTSEIVSRHRIFSVRSQRSRSPDSGKEGQFFVIDAGNWVNVIALTEKDEVVLVEQYRHGNDEISLEIPGGCIDPADPSPLVAAQRELQEETGYSGQDWIELGWNAPNPALLSNRCYTYLARDVRLTGNQKLDGMEEINVLKVALADIPKLIADKTITHSLVITGFYYLDLWKRAHGG
jgi:ADP-ribose pyrophosphatase